MRGWLALLAWLALAGCGACGAPPPTRVILIGLDGATWQVIEPLRARGLLPAFDRLVREGATGVAQSIREPHAYESAALWTTVATGVHPEVHGILANAMEGAPPTANMRRVSALWNIASAHGRSVATVGWFVTWPAEAVNGISVSDQAWLIDDRGASPPQVLAELGAEHFWAWEPASARNREALRRFIDFDFEPDFERHPRDGPAWFRSFLVSERLSWVYPRDESFARIGLALLERDRPDLLAIYFRGIDFTSHAFWMFHEPGAEGYHPRARERITPELLASFGSMIERYYAYQDEVLGRFLAAADADTLVLVVSDHGFGPGRNFYDANWFLSGTHRAEGIIAAWGANVRPSARIPDATLFDVAPTVLAALDLPVGRDMEGRVLGEMFERPPEVHTVASHDPGGPRPAQAPIESPDRDALRERLRALGYLE
jgi:predicted AlkP superfamily phosphohydrolase/phosphomutase